MAGLPTPESFASECPPGRIIGFETEYELRDARGQEAATWPQELLKPSVLEAAGLAVWKAGAANAWLSNGAYIYRDVGDHIEYCTGEGLGPYEATLGLHAGSAVLNNIVVASERPYQIYRRSATVHPESGKIITKGFHSNFCIPDTVGDAATLHPLESLWATQLYAWGGIVTQGGFNISPKSVDIGTHLSNQVANRTNTGLKPFGIVRNAGAGGDADTNDPRHQLGRIEDRTKTPSSPWSDFMGAATTSIALRIPEHPGLTRLNRQLRGLVLRDSVRTLRQVGTDVEMRNLYELQDGRKFRAVDIQHKLAELATSLSANVELPADEQFALHEWVSINDQLDKVSRGELPLQTVADRIGWAGKYAYLVKKLGAEAVNTGHIDALRFCLAWDRVVPRGAGQIFSEKRGPAVITPDEYKEFTTDPPRRTRASIRAAHIKTPVDATGCSLTNVRWPYVVRSNPRRTVSSSMPLHPYAHAA